MTTTLGASAVDMATMQYPAQNVPATKPGNMLERNIATAIARGKAAIVRKGQGYEENEQLQQVSIINKVLSFFSPARRYEARRSSDNTKSIKGGGGGVVFICVKT